MGILVWIVKARRNKRIGRYIALCLCVIVGMNLLLLRALQAESQIYKRAKSSMLFGLDEIPRGKHKLTDYWSYENKLTLERTVERNYDLDVVRADDLDFFSAELDFVFAYVPSAEWDAYIDLELVDEVEFKDDADAHAHDAEFNIEELNVVFRGLLPKVVVKAGRQSYKDRREWLYDEELDAVRIFYQSDRFGVDASISGDKLFQKNLASTDKRKNIYNLFLLAKYHGKQNGRYAAYLFIRNNHEAEEQLRWLGLRAAGEPARGYSYWLESAYLGGKSRNSPSGRYQRIAAYGLDLGGTFVFSARLSPSISIGWAYGSGDHDSESGVDTNFRQTGLQDNNGRFNGFTGFKYYGEILEPELSNLSIVTAGLGVHPFRKTSIDLLYHEYTQPAKANQLRDSNLEMDPVGEGRDIGKEVDLILSFKAIENMSMELVYGRFSPGNAFGTDAKKATHVNFKLEYKF